MKESQRYLKIVTWSEEDQGFIGQCPSIIGPCCHGDDETHVYAELCQIVEEWIEILKQDRKPLPRPIATPDIANLFSGYQPPVGNALVEA